MTDLATSPNGTTARQRDDNDNDTRQLAELANSLGNEDPLAEVRANLTEQLAAAANKVTAAEAAANKNTAARKRAEQAITAARDTIKRCSDEAGPLLATVKAAKEAETRIKGALAKLDPTRRAR
jgi:chromosome segregation ATPase